MTLRAHIHYVLGRKNYDELIVTNVIVPRVLLLVLVPDHLTDWTELTADQLLLRRCAYWISLRGLQPTENETSVTVYIPRANIFTVEVLCSIMDRINGGLPL
jgi:hypothetical protein